MGSTKDRLHGAWSRSLKQQKTSYSHVQPWWRLFWALPGCNLGLSGGLLERTSYTAAPMHRMQSCG